MSNGYATEQMRNDYERSRKAREEEYNLCSEQPLSAEQVNEYRKKWGMPPMPVHTRPADNGNRQRRTDAEQVSANVNKPAPEYTGGSVSYYRVKVEKPTSKDLPPYEAECNDIIEALQMNYAEGNAFKAIWRKCAAQLGKAKAGYKDGLYDSEKVEFFGGRMVAQNKVAR